MTEAEKNRLVHAWIAGQKADEGSKIEAENWWAISAMFDMPWDDPELAWDLTLRIYRTTDDLDVRSVLAAGPLEDIMKQHGSAFIGRVETLAMQEPSFKELMRGVWLSQNDQSEWRRFYAAADIQPFGSQRDS